MVDPQMPTTTATAPSTETAELLEDALFQVKRVDRRPRPDGGTGAGVPAGPRPLPDRRRARSGQDAHRVDDGPGHGRLVRRGSSSPPTWCRPTSSAPASGGHLGRSSTSSGARMFANIVLADEINRAPAKVQSALLEVMAERQVSIGGHTRKIPTPFLVLATQNPIESEGVYALPEAQRDRFMMQITVHPPSYEEETEIARRMGVRPPKAEQVLTTDQLLALQSVVRRRVRPPCRAGLRGPPRDGDPRSSPRGASASWRRTSPSARAPGRPSACCRRDGRSPSSVDGGSSFPRTSSTWRLRFCAIASC